MYNTINLQSSYVLVSCQLFFQWLQNVQNRFCGKVESVIVFIVHIQILILILQGRLHIIYAC